MKKFFYSPAVQGYSIGILCSVIIGLGMGIPILLTLKSSAFILFVLLTRNLPIFDYWGWKGMWHGYKTIS